MLVARRVYWAALQVGLVARLVDLAPYRVGLVAGWFGCVAGRSCSVEGWALEPVLRFGVAAHCVGLVACFRGFGRVWLVAIFVWGLSSGVV